MDNEFSRVVDVLPGLVWTARADGHVDFVNQGWRDYTGASLDDACGDGWLSAVHPDDVSALRDGWRHILASARPQDLRARLRRFDGSWRRFLLRVNPLDDDGATVTHWCGMLVDIDDCQPVADDAGATLKDFAAIADVLPASVLLMTPDGDVEYANRLAQEFRGATLEQQRGWKSTNLIHPDEMPAAIAEWARCVKTGERFEMDFRVRRADGVYRWFHVRALPVHDAQGRITRWCTLDEDIDDRKRSEAMLASTLEALAASEDRLRATIDAVPGFVWRAAPDGSVEFLNQRWCDYTGISLQESLGLGWTSRIHPDDAPALGEYWQTLLQAGEPGSFEARLRRFDGVYRWFLIRAVPLLDDAGRVLKWYGQNTDIEDRKRAEMLLEGEKHLLSLIAGGSPLAQVLDALCALVQSTVDGALCSVLLIDPRRTRAWQESALHLRLQSGAGPDIPDVLMQEADGRPLEPDSSPFAQVATHGEPLIVTDLRQETRWPAWRPAALERGMHASWSMPVRFSCGNVIGVFSLLFREPRTPESNHHDLLAQFTHLASIAVERARREAALKQSQAFMTKAQQLSLTGTFSWRVGGDHIVWSNEVYRILELDPAVTPTFELIYTRIHPDDVPAHHEMIQRQRATASDFEHEHRLLLPDGSIRWVHLVAHATRDEDGGVEYIAALQDITQRRRDDEALGKVRSELAHLARVASLGALTASIAHEVNQPLAGIITNANTCLRMLGAEPPNVDGARETARRTIRDGNRASDVIKRLRALFSKKAISIESMDLNEAAREVIAMLLGELQRNGVILHPEFADELPPVKGDRVQLQQVILNLILNASDAMRSITDRPRHLRVSTAGDDEGVRLSVHDNGIGFDGQDADRLFNAFYTTKSSGMGIGLSVSRSIIESHDGRLWATPNDGPGATFCFVIPRFTVSSPEALDETTVSPDTDADADHAMESF